MKINFKKNITSVILIILMAVFVLLMGKGGVPADFVKQNSWHLISAKVLSGGEIEVKTSGENLALHSGVRVSADSRESGAFSADMVRDGIKDDKKQRWSSANDWDNNEHWLEISFPEEVTVGLIRIYWERTNACYYTLEYSSDRKNWLTAAEFRDRPSQDMQDIYLAEPVSAKYLRLHVMDVIKEEEDLSLYYQNVSVLEMEVYEGIEDNFVIEKLKIPQAGRRWLAENEAYIEEAAGGQYQESIVAVLYPEVPESYSLKFVGADYDMLIAADGKISDNIADTKAEVGFALEKEGVSYELPGMEVQIPCAQEDESLEVSDRTQAGSGDKAGLPEGCSAMEWVPYGGTYGLTNATKVVISKEYEEELLAVASLFAKELSELLGRDIQTVVINEDEDADYDIETDDIYLSLYYASKDETENIQWINGIGDEGYELFLQSGKQAGTQILAATAQGVRWGCVSMLSLLEQTHGELPKGRLRDYPRYSVRGFGIDVGRRAVPMEMLYDIVREMSKHKMNTLTVHLNDNSIITQSDYDGTIEGARTLYSGFRLESNIKNEEGEGLTSTDLYYTKKEFMQFIEDAAVYGVEIVPEIDTPAHCLFITKVFPNLGLSGNPESADHLDLSKAETTGLVKKLWGEYLNDDMGTAVFGGCNTVHIGMDEYYGDEKEYIAYLNEISDYIHTAAPDKNIRMWGSLSGIKAENTGKLNDIQMHIWNTDWADPQEMYDSGFSVINSLSGSLYIIPGGGYDWLKQDFLEESWQPNIFETQERTWILPEYSPQMLGASYMLWNDLQQLNGESISDEALFERFLKPLPVIARKLWGNTSENG